MGFASAVTDMKMNDATIKEKRIGNILMAKFAFE